MLSLQDWLAMDSTLRSDRIREERVNCPYDSYHQWKYRMHLTIEELLRAKQLNMKIKTMITRSKR
jgi:4-alpha-glucanotransferase